MKYTPAFTDNNSNTYRFSESFSTAEEALQRAEEVLDNPETHQVIGEDGAVVSASVLDPYQEPSLIEEPDDDKKRPVLSKL